MEFDITREIAEAMTKIEGAHAFKPVEAVGSAAARMSRHLSGNAFQLTNFTILNQESN